MAPRHLAVIMDGNGRWAKKRLLPRAAGHREGMKRMIALAEHAFSRGAEYVTMYALSAENLLRPQEELDALYSLFREYFTVNTDRLVRQGIRLRILGDLSLLPEEIAALLRGGEERASGGEKGTLALAIGYGGRQEILSAVNAAVRGGKELDAPAFEALLSTAGMPAPDLLIRTGGEKRLSNFLLYQCAYTELYFSDKMFPAFTDADLDKAFEDYGKRDRRFGGIARTE